MQNLGLDEDTPVSVELVDLPPGRFAKLQPQSSDFLEIEDPRRAYAFLPVPLLFPSVLSAFCCV